MASTDAERQRRARARKRAANDPLRIFLTGIVDDVKAAMADPDVTVKPFHFARMQTATDLLTKLEAGAESTVSLSHLYFAHGAETSGEQLIVRDQHEADFANWCLVPGNLPPEARESSSAVLDAARTSLKWANAERAAGRGTSPVLAEGLRAAARLISARTSPVTSEAYRQFTNARAALAFHSRTTAMGGPDVPWDAPYDVFGEFTDEEDPS